jgi:putative FmdB family regulatory protein
MPIYQYKCPCNFEFEVYTKTYKPSTYITCEKCGKKAKKIISLPNTDLVNNERWSNTMGVNPRQIPEAMKKYPGSVYNQKGQLRIDNRKDKLKKAKERGFRELD